MQDESVIDEVEKNQCSNDKQSDNQGRVIGKGVNCPLGGTALRAFKLCPSLKGASCAKPMNHIYFSCDRRSTLFKET